MRQRYIQSFNTVENEQTAIDNKELGKPYVAYIKDGQYIDWNTKDIDYNSMPLTFEIISGGTIIWKKVGDSVEPVTISFSKNGGSSWDTITSSIEGTPLNVETGEKIIFKHDGSLGRTIYTYNIFNSTEALFKTYGNPLSLILSTGFANVKNLVDDLPAKKYQFYRLFDGCTGLTDASNLVFPAVSFLSFNDYDQAISCYEGMFRGCSNLEYGPTSLPAITLAQYCYCEMFKNCTNLKTGPIVLPAQNILLNSYSNMFNGCRNLENAPDILSTGVPAGLYGMFVGCSKIKRIKCLVVPDYYSNNTTPLGWLYNASQTGIFIKNPDAEIITKPDTVGWRRGTDGIPTGWTVVDAE